MSTTFPDDHRRRRRRRRFHQPRLAQPAMQNRYDFTFTDQRFKGSMVVSLFAVSQSEANAQAYLLADTFVGHLKKIRLSTP